MGIPIFDRNPRRLITIPMSHYCEKARWGLERLGLPYYEERHLQLFHYPRTYWVSHGPNVPVLIDGKQVVSDSTHILMHLDQYADMAHRLYPDDPAQHREVEQWEDLFDEQLGVDSRRWVYYHMLPYPAEALITAGQGAPAHERKLAPYGYGLMKLFFNRAMQINPRNVADGVQRSRQTIEQTDQLLDDGRPYLLGDRFTAADLALASMMAPYVLPRNYGIRLPTPDEVPQSMRAEVAYFRDTRTGQFVLRLYETERQAKVFTAPETQKDRAVV